MSFLRPNQTGGVQVPNYPRLRKYTDEIERLTKFVREAEGQIAHLERQGAQLSTESTSISAKIEASTRQAAISEKARQLENEKNQAEARIQGLRSEHDEWLHNFGSWIVEKHKLEKELATASDDAPDIALELQPQRTKDRVVDELLAVIQRIANFSGDEKLQREALETQREIAATRSYVILENTYARLKDGRLVTMDELQQLACNHGSDAPMLKAARSSAYHRGTRVNREEAASLGVS